MQPSQKRLSVDAVVRSTGFSRKETGLLETSIRVFAVLAERGQERHEMPITIGGFGIRWHIAEKYTGRVAGGGPTDIDLAFLTLPGWLKSHLIEDQLIESEKIRYGGIDGVRVTRILTGHSVFHLRPDLSKEMGLFSDICFFEGKVCIVPLRPVDIERAHIIHVFSDAPGEVHIGTDIRIADPGYLLATTLNPQAATLKRAFRAVMMLASLGDAEFRDAVERYVEIVKAAGLAPEQLRGALELIDRPQVKKWEFREIIGKFLEEVQTRMGKILTA